MNKLLSAAAIAVAVVSSPAFATSPEELQAQIETLKQKEGEKNAEIAALRKKIKTLETYRSSNVQPPAAGVNSNPHAAMAAVPFTKAPAIAPAPSWAGFYFGVGVSHNQTRMDQGTATTSSDNGVTTVVDTHSLSKTDFTNADHLMLGYMWQFDKWLAGVEADYTFSQRASWLQYTGLSGGNCGVAFSGDFTCAGVNPYGTFETIGHLRALAGYAVTPHLMGFVSGGLAVGKATSGAHTAISIASSPNSPVFTATDSFGSRDPLLGYSLGAGAQIKLTENLLARFEYVHDVYRGPATSGSFATLTNNGHTTSITVPSEKVRITNDAIRTSLIYRLDPDMSPRASVGGLWSEFTTSPALYANTWAGFYVGGGLTQNNYKIIQDSGITLTISDSATGTNVSAPSGMSRETGFTAGHLLAGYRLQWNRFLVGVEGDWDFRASRDFLGPDKSPGQFGGNTAVQTCYPQFGPNVVCLGLGMGGTPTFQSKGHLRLTGGFVITPDLMAFVSGGRAWGIASGSTGASANGIVFAPPGAPLVGGATVTRSFDPASIRGNTIGGGFEAKATQDIFIRGEYYHDWYTWNHLPVGGAGFGGTTGTITVNSFAAAQDHQRIINDAYRVSLIYRFWNPQSGSPGLLSSLFSK